MGRLSIYGRQRVINMRKRHMSFLQIQKELQEQDGISISRHGIGNFWQRYQKTHMISDEPRSGRKPKLNMEHKNFIDTKMSENHELSGEQIQEMLKAEFNVNISLLTIQRTRKKLGWKFGQTRYCQMITEKNRLERLAFATRCLDDNDDFANVIFVDEATIQMECNVLQQWHKEGEPLHKRLRPKAKHPYKVNVWAGISNRGATDIVIFTGNMTAEFYITVLNDHLLPFIHDKFPDSHRYFQDNDPKHTANVTKDFIADHNINWFKSPPESPDINPIENLWHSLKHFLRKTIKPKTKEDLVAGITEYWGKLNAEQCKRYIQHIHKVLPVVVERDGKASGF